MNIVYVKANGVSPVIPEAVTAYMNPMCSNLPAAAVGESPCRKAQQALVKYDSELCVFSRRLAMTKTIFFAFLGFSGLFHHLPLGAIRL